jgi:hypothetical protein
VDAQLQTTGKRKKSCTLLINSIDINSLNFKENQLVKVIYMKIAEVSINDLTNKKNMHQLTGYPNFNLIIILLIC